ncbi:DUF3187 family protein [Oryzomonas japonica]|uniref:DUF3187 family protein n=1 Tax=Oryzomonas japonica TaxID=2603858 RepID=A0A7J4ZVC4_9BACT|nr:DUF3187 family protein [Oryzomonas japonica]KAB0667547.1 DUF3187 family protein [Oryzomonas japonica]
MNRMLPLSLLLLLAMAGPAAAEDMEITPFRTVNQSPLVQIFGLPPQSEATVAPSGKTVVSLVQDVASDYTVSSTSREQIHLDGESYRWTLAARYGFGGRFDAGFEIPYVLYGGGFLDSFIVEWHKFFGLPQGGRDSAPKGRLHFSYTKDGVQKLKMDHADSGLGDISLTGGMQLYEARDGESHDSLALRASLKLPSGDSNSLRGSGSTDATLALCGSMNNFTEWGALGVFGSLGGMAMSDGDVLRDQQQHLVGFGTVGLGWGPWSRVSFKFQLNAHTAFYRGSTLDELSKPSLMLVSGGAIKLPGDYRLDIGVSEDVAVATAPDVAFHLGVSKQF